VNKLLLGALLIVSCNAYGHSALQEAILNSDYETVAAHYNGKEISPSMQHAYLSLADDTATMRRNNVAFDWAKAFVSLKLLLSAGLMHSFSSSFSQASAKLQLKKIHADMYNSRYPTNAPERDASISSFLATISFGFFIWALCDGNKYYRQLHEKIKAAERIKFLIMSQQDQ